MQPDRSNPLALVREAGKRCPDCGEYRPASAFYLRQTGELSAYCKPHQRKRAQASYQRRRQDPAALARMRELDRLRKRASRARLKNLGSRRAARLASSQETAARRLIAAHPEEYRALLAAEGTKHGHHNQSRSGGGSDVA
jgi:hypothetical protein